MKLLTRKEIIEIWSRQSNEMLNAFYCPECRDLLTTDKNGELYCLNTMCKNKKKYKEPS
jgi:hypothetical protein